MKFSLKSKGRSDVIDITAKVEKVLYESKIKEGMMFVFVPHSTAAIAIMEYESGVVRDFSRIMEEFAPASAVYEHHKAGNDDNGAAHIKAAVIGPDVSVPIEGGELVLGPWQQIVLIDFDDRSRDREIFVKIISG